VEGLADIFAQDTIAMTPSLNLTLGCGFRRDRAHHSDLMPPTVPG
jgi:hypothetical protein